MLKNTRLLAFCGGIGFLLFASHAFAACSAAGIDFSAKVQRVIDGDSIRLEGGRELRIIGINAPEYEMPRGDQARKRLRNLIENRRVYLQIGEATADRYGRTLAHVFDKAGNNLAETLLREGYAFYAFVSPNDYNAACYVMAEKKARSNNRGVWKLPFYQFREAPDSNLGTGFMRLAGDVERVEMGKSGGRIFLQDSRVQLFVPQRHLPALGGVQKLLNAKRIGVRGWLSSRNKGVYSMLIGHPLMVEYIL